ncbi:hypothetical protein Bca101_021084 [Brassica carinata]
MKRLKLELAEAYHSEERYLRKKSWQQWLKSGDKNTRFFHNAVKGRKNLNSILMLLDNLGVEHFSEGAKGNIAVDFFRELFESSNPFDLESLYEGFENRVFTEMNSLLSREITDDKIKLAAFGIKGSSTPGEDVSYSVLLNGKSHGFIRPERGIRQGDPLSPFLFIMCAEALVHSLHRAEASGKLTGILLSTDGPLPFAPQDIPKILAIRPRPMHEDRLRWAFTGFASYTSQSGYRLLETIRDLQSLETTTLPPIEQQLWRDIWKTKTSPKIRHFLWRILSGALASNEPIRSRGWSQNSVFLNLHFLMKISKARSADTENMRSFHWVLWHIWKARNSLLSEQTSTSSHSILERAREETDLWFNVNFPTQQDNPPLQRNSDISWKKPETNAVKCNIASSWLRRTSMGGAAWILRDHNGTPLLRSRRAYSNVVSPLHADILSLYWAVESMHNLQRTKLIFEVLSVELRDVLQSPTRYQEHHDIPGTIHILLSNIDSWCLRFASPTENTTVCELYCGEAPDPDKWEASLIGHYIGIGIATTSSSKSTNGFPVGAICSYALRPRRVRARRLLSNVASLLKPGGYFFGITPDSSTIWAKYQKNVEAYHNRSGGTKPNVFPNYIRSESNMITFEVEEEKFPLFGKSFFRLAWEAGLEYVEIQSLTDFYDDNRAQFASLMMNAGPNFVDPRGKLLPRAFDLLGLYATFIFQKPDPDLEPPLRTPIPFDSFND